LFSGFNKLATVPSGNLSNAALVGANTVKGPLPFNVLTKSAALLLLLMLCDQLNQWQCQLHLLFVRKILLI